MMRISDRSLLLARFENVERLARYLRIRFDEDVNPDWLRFAVSMRCAEK